MFQSQVCVTQVVLLMFLSNSVRCQEMGAEISSGDVYPPTYDYYRANYQPNNQVPANGLPFIVKDVNYHDARQSQQLHAPEGIADSAQHYAANADRKDNIVQVSQTANTQGAQNTNPQSSQSSCSAYPAKQAAPAVASTGTTSLMLDNNETSPDTVTPSSAAAVTIQNSPKLAELQKIVQQLYVAQAQVQLEANEIQRAQTIAGAAQQALEEASNNVRVIQAALHAAQESVAGCALRAQTAQLQLAAHDQLLFIARQKVDALSAQMVGLQAEEGIGEARIVVDLPTLLAKLKEPLPDSQKPTPIPSILGDHSGTGSISAFRATQVAQIPSASQSIQDQSTFQPQPVPVGKSSDTNKFYEQLRSWNEQSQHKLHAVSGKDQNLNENVILNEDGIDELDESPESSLSRGTQLREDTKVSASPKKNELTDEDVKTLVEFIMSTEPKAKDQTLAAALNSKDMAKKAENEKYIDDFLNSIKNSAIQVVPSSKNRDNVIRSPKMDSKITDRLLTLHDSLFHPNSRQVSFSSENEQNKVGQMPNAEEETLYDITDDASSIRSHN